MGRFLEVLLKYKFENELFFYMAVEFDKKSDKYFDFNSKICHRKSNPKARICSFFEVRVLLAPKLAGFLTILVKQKLLVVKKCIWSVKSQSLFYK